MYVWFMICMSEVQPRSNIYQESLPGLIHLHMYIHYMGRKGVKIKQNEDHNEIIPCSLKEELKFMLKGG